MVTSDSMVACLANQATTSTGLVDIEDLYLTIGPNEVWIFNAQLSMHSTSAAGIKFGVNAPSGSTIEWRQFGTTIGATAINASRSTSLNTAGTAMCTVNGDGIINISGVVFNGATAGNIQLRFLKYTSRTATIYKGSYLTGWRIA